LTSKPISPFLITFVLWIIVVLIGLTIYPAMSIVSMIWMLLFIFLFFGLPLLFAGVKIIPEYERAAVLRLGRYIGMMGPGIIFIDPIFDKAYRFDLRVQTVDIPSQEVLTKDNINIKVDAVIIYRVIDPGKAFITVREVPRLLYQYGQAI